VIKKLFAVVLFLCCCQPVWATTWYARTPCTNNGDGTASGCAVSPSGSGAWNSFANIVWSGAGIVAGDTLYIIGTFTAANLMVGVAGTAGNIITIRGDHGDGAGQIGNATTGRRICVNSYTNYSYLTSYGGLRECYDFESTLSQHIQFIAATNEVRDYDKQLIANGFTSNDQFLARVGANNRHMYGIASNPTDEGTYERMYLNTAAEGGQWMPVTDEAQTPYDFYKKKKITNITVDHCIVYADDSTYDPFDLGGVRNLTISNSEASADGKSTNGAFYTDGNDSWIRPDNIVIENNYFHDIGKTTFQAGDLDAHCIGVQAVNGIIIRGNTLKNCAAGIVIYPGSSANQAASGVEISRNLIEGMNYSRNPGQFGGSGIMFSGVDQCPLCDPALVAYNIITTPVNCPVTKTTYECAGIGSKWSVKSKFYNNTLVANDYNFAFDAQSAISADTRNNISYNPGAYHIALYPTEAGSWTEDYNTFFPNTGTKFQVGGASYYNFADYKTNHHTASTNAHSIVTDPTFVSATDFHLQSGSPAVNAGVNVSLTTDYAGRTVPQGVAPDVGALEWYPVALKIGTGAAPKIGVGSALIVY
jgi:hypothetical protein